MTSSQLVFYFTVEELTDESVFILSVFHDKLLISGEMFSKLFIYSHDGLHISNVQTNNSHELTGATWTARGNIAYTAYSNEVVVMSESSTVITIYTQLKNPRYISVFSDILYIVDMNTVVYQSKDEGVSWNLVFQINDDWIYWQRIKVTTNFSDDFWTLRYNNNENYYYQRLYSVPKNIPHNFMTWTDISFTITNSELISFPRKDYRSSCYDNNMNIFLSYYDKKAVHMFSINGQYYCQLLSSYNITYKPRTLAVDNERQLLYVGQDMNVVEVFQFK